LWLLNIIREGIPYFYTIQKSFMHLHKIFYALAATVPWGSIAWKIVQKASNKVYNVKASISKRKYGVTSTPGTITLNGSKYGASAMYNV
ncbi:hypothetical protein, partial [Levilactobacillus brevis]